MAQTNFSEESLKKLQELYNYCSPELVGGIRNVLIVLSGINVLFSSTAFVGNSLILVALHKENSLYPPSKHLLRSLATTDLCVGLIVEPLEVTFWMSLVYERWGICRFVLTVDTVASYMLCSASLSTLTAISLDRLLALILGLRYRQIVTLRRSFIVVSVLWCVSTFVATMYVWNPSIAEWCTYIFVSLCLVTSIFSYSKIYLTLNHQQIQVQEHQRRAIPVNVARYKRAVNSALWLQLTLIACYLPYNIARALLTKRGLSPDGFIAIRILL